MAHVYNSDIQGLHNRINRFIIEAMKSVSHASSLINEFDMQRIKQYLSALRYYHGYIMAQPRIDAPETTPKEYLLQDNPTVPPIENEMLKDIIRMFERMRDEMVSSQSARQAAGLIEFDSARLISYVSHTENYIAEYVLNAQPIDLPESSPMTAVSGPGQTGVNP